MDKNRHLTRTGSEESRDERKYGFLRLSDSLEFGLLRFKLFLSKKSSWIFTGLFALSVYQITLVKVLSNLPCFPLLTRGQIEVSYDLSMSLVASLVFYFVNVVVANRHRRFNFTTIHLRHIVGLVRNLEGLKEYLFPSDGTVGAEALFKTLDDQISQTGAIIKIDVSQMPTWLDKVIGGCEDVLRTPTFLSSELMIVVDETYHDAIVSKVNLRAFLESGGRGQTRNALLNNLAQSLTSLTFKSALFDHQLRQGRLLER